MIEKWLTKDIQKTFDRGYYRFVLSDPSGEAGYLCDHLPKNWTVKEAHTDLEELEVKYHVEKGNSKMPVVFYTHIPIEKLKFLMEYAIIYGHLDLSQFHQYIKKKVHAHIGLNLNIGKEELLTAAKVSIGKEKSYWMDLCHKGAKGIFDLKTMLPEFINDPEGYANKMDDKVRDAFFSNIQESTGQQIIKKPAGTLAKETINIMLSGLVNNKIDDLLLQVYHNMIDSKTYKASFQNYLENFVLPQNVNIWSIHSDHPFEQIDKQQLKQVVGQLNDNDFFAKVKPQLEARAKNNCAKLLDITWWNDLLNLLYFDASAIKTIVSFEEAVTYYTQTFYKLDKSIRKLYAKFLNEPDIIQPMQEKYQSWVNYLLSKWFKYFKEYHQNQKGVLNEIIENNTGKIAIIVGDGINYELAKAVNGIVGNKLKCTEEFMLADLPSVTDNNMSRLYLADGAFSDNKKEREKKLNNAFPEKNIKHQYLEDINQTSSECDVLVCSYKDIDDLGEKMQQNALKYFDTIVETLSEKIIELNEFGFSKIYFVSDHGFVLTGLLGEADKIDFSPVSDHIKGERFIASKEKESVPEHLMHLEKKYKDFNWLILSKNLRSFKTTGSYGYAHGGASPQELILPFFKYESKHNSIQLNVSIVNKNALKEVEGENFDVRIKASSEGGGDLFTSQRKCKLSIFCDNTAVSTSDSFTIESGRKIKREFSFDGKKELQIYLIDAKTKEQIDKAVVKKNTGRDMGGLI